MDAFDILRDGFARVADELPTAIGGLSSEELAWQLAPDANHIGWLAWHIGRCEDAQLAALVRIPDVYAGDWADRFDLPLEVSDIGYGHTPEQVRSVQITDPALLVAYYAAVHAQTERILASMTPDDLHRLVDDPYRVSVGVRLVSVINDITQHLGQISYLKGLLASR